MNRSAKVSDLARLAAITATPRPVTSVEATSEPMVRYTAEVPKRLHRSLKTFAMDHDTSTYVVTRALLTLLDSDQEVAERVRKLVAS